MANFKNDRITCICMNIQKKEFNLIRNRAITSAQIFKSSTKLFAANYFPTAVNHTQQM